MDKNKKIINGLLVLAGLQILLLIFVNFFSFSSIKTRKVSKSLLRGITEKSISSLGIKDKIDGFELIKEGSQWFVSYEGAKLPGDQEKITSYVKMVSELQEGTVIYKGTDASSDETYGFTENNIRNLTVKTAKKEYQVQLGNAGPIKGSSYLRFSGDNRIRLIESNVVQKTDRVYKEWTRRDLFPKVTASQVINYKIEGNSSFISDRYNIVKQKAEEGKTDLYVVEPVASGELDQNAVVRMVNGILSLKADNFKLSGTVDGKETVASVEFSMKDGKMHQVKFYKVDDDNDVGDFIAVTDLDPYLFLFHEDSLTKVFKNRKDLVSQPKTE